MVKSIWVYAAMVVLFVIYAQQSTFSAQSQADQKPTRAHSSGNAINQGKQKEAIPPQGAQQNVSALTNDDIIEFVKNGFTDDFIIGQIKTGRTNFVKTGPELIRLKKAGVSERVIEFILDPTKPENPPPKPSTETAQTGSPSATPGEKNAAVIRGLPTEIGIYVKKADKWEEVDPEVVNWKTGGVLKSVGSMGIVKPDMNGKINGPRSRNTVASPMEFLIVAPEGTALTEYQFIKLREHTDSREFRTVTGGVFHVSGGATRDLVPFEGKKIAPRMFSVSFSKLTPGEYGFLPPGAFTHSSASAQLGKMYTFRVTE
jgi:hypothetical protein